MKNINITNIVDPTSLQPFTGNSLKFLQDASSEARAGMIKAFITQNLGSYSLTVPYVISGCVYSGTTPNFAVTAGEIFYGGEYYELTAVSGYTNIPQFKLDQTQDATADPLDFSDGQTWSVHDIFKFIGEDTVTAKVFDATDLVSAYGTGKITSQLSQATFSTSSTSYVDVTGMTYTNGTGVDKVFHIVGKLYMDTTVSAPNYSFLQMYDGTNELDSTVAGMIGLGSNGYWCLTVSYVGIITAGTTVKLRLKNNSGTQVDFANVTMTIIEI